MINGVHSLTVMVPRSGVSTVRVSTSGSVLATVVARVFLVPDNWRNATSTVGGGYPRASWPISSRKKNRNSGSL